MFKRILIAVALVALGALVVEATVLGKPTVKSNGDVITRHGVYMRSAVGPSRLDTLIDAGTTAKLDTSQETFSFMGADSVRLWTFGNQLTANDTVFVIALIADPWDSLYTAVALDTLIGDSGNETKDVTALIDGYNRFWVQVKGGTSSGADSTEYRIGFEELRRGAR